MGTHPEPPIAGDDTATMLGSLERQRATFAWKCEGVDEAGLTTTVGVSALTLGGLLLHLALIEDLYFSARLTGADMRELWPDADFDAPDWEWQAATEQTPDVLLGSWQQAVLRSRAVLDELLPEGGLDQLARHGSWDEAPSLRRTLADLIEEYARHVGHADLIREAVDGSTGEDPPPDLPGYPK